MNKCIICGQEITESQNFANAHDECLQEDQFDDESIEKEKS